MGMRKSRKLFGIMVLTALLSALLTAGAFAASPKLNKTKITLYVGETATLKLKGTAKKVKWSSSKKTVAAVTKKGKVTAKKAGTASISAKISGKKYVCKVTVKKPSSSYLAKTAALKDYRNILTDNNAYVRFTVKNIFGDSTPELLAYSKTEGGYLHLWSYDTAKQKTILITTGKKELYVNQRKKTIITHEHYNGDFYSVCNYKGEELVTYSRYKGGRCYRNEEIILAAKKFRNEVNGYLKSAVKYTPKKAVWKNTKENRKKYLS